MKTKLLLPALLLLTTLSSLAQGRAQVFSLTPLAKNVVEVNGMAMGIGFSWGGATAGATINGLNLEINPLSPFFILIQDPVKGGREGDAAVEVNGLHIAVGGFNGNGIVNGLGISVYNIGYACNGVSITGLYNTSGILNGLHISGIANTADKGVGLLIAPINNTAQYGGLQLGLYNNADNLTGVQIGIFNRSKEVKGLQIGLWNTNSKRSLPFINW